VSAAAKQSYAIGITAQTCRNNGVNFWGVKSSAVDVEAAEQHILSENNVTWRRILEGNI
jgi:hypothetical protein